MRLKSVKDINLKGKRVLFRVDYNTPLKKVRGKLAVADDSRIQLTLPTLHYLISKKAKIIIATHLGRPDGKPVKSLKITPVARHLEKIIGQKVTTTPSTTGPQAKKIISAMNPGEVAFIENTRFHPGETKNNASYAKQIASLADIIVNDGFAVCHRVHASVVGVSKYIPMVAGLYLMLEVKMLNKLTTSPKRPFVAIIGGAKISDKVAAISNLAQIADTVLVGGGVANNFLKAGGVDVLSSYMQDVVADEKKRGVDFVKFAKKLLDIFHRQRMLVHKFIPVPRIAVPLDVIAAKKMDGYHQTSRINLIKSEDNHCTKNLMYLDIGKTTIKFYKQVISQAGTIFWNGPMGVFEKDAFSRGTKSIAKAIAKSKGTSILGGGDTIAAISKFKLRHKYDYVSGAGGATLEFLAGKKLPGIEPMRVK